MHMTLHDFGMKLQKSLEILFLLMILLFFELLEHSFNLVMYFSAKQCNFFEQDFDIYKKCI